MSVRRGAYEIWCDSCGNWMSVYDAKNVIDARHEAQKHGWRYTRNTEKQMLDLCKHCYEKA